MIYIFDDNKYNQLSSNYKLDYLEYFAEKGNYLKYIQNHGAYDFKSLTQDADCVLIHNSFPDEVETGKIKAICKREKIPLVVFSNQYTGTIFADSSKIHIPQIKKDRMYFNFQHFVDFYIEKGKIDLDLLAMGKNYDIEKALIIQDRLCIYLFLKEGSFNFYRCFEEEQTEWKELKELFFLASPNDDFDLFQEENENVSAAELSKIIKTLTTQILEKHGYQNSCH